MYQIMSKCRSSNGQKIIDIKLFEVVLYNSYAYDIAV